MPYTVPNQRVITIHRERATSDFLGIKNSNWQSAACELGAHATLLYLYLASNANGFQLALSPRAIQQSVGMPASTYRDQFLKLVDKGYLVQRAESNIYDFYETPQRATCESNEETSDTFKQTNPAYASTNVVETETPEIIEINNTNTINSINKCGVEKQVSPPPKENIFIF